MYLGEKTYSCVVCVILWFSPAACLHLVSFYLCLHSLIYINTYFTWHFYRSSAHGYPTRCRTLTQGNSYISQRAAFHVTTAYYIQYEISPQCDVWQHIIHTSDRQYVIQPVSARTHNLLVENSRFHITGEWKKAENLLYSRL